MNGKGLVLSLTLLSGYILSNAQQITVDTIPFKTYDFVVSLSSDLVNGILYPNNFKASNGIVLNVTKYSFPDTNKFILKIKNDWKQRNNVTDEGQTSIKYGLIKKGPNCFIRKLNTEVRYGVTEIGGGSMVKKYLEILNKDVDEIICLFNDSIINEEYQVSLIQVKVPEWMIKNTNMYGFQDYQFKNNIKLSFNYRNISYSIYYTSDLCKNGIQYGRHETSGTSLPVQINLQLRLLDITQNKQQIIFQNQTDSNVNLIGLMYGDIDNDNELDIIYSILDGACEYKLVFLSSKKTENSMLGYVGYSEGECIYP